MDGSVLCIALLAALIGLSQEHVVGNATCGLKFQEHIKEAVALKLECSNAAFNDCCQVCPHQGIYCTESLMLISNNYLLCI